MKKTVIGQLKIITFAGMMVFLGGCGIQKQTVWTNDYLVTLYTTPRQVQTGENQIAFRVQDRDYRILELKSAQLVLQGPGVVSSEALILKSGPGRDWRGWLTIPRTGNYELIMTFSIRGQDSISASFLLNVSEEH